MAIEKISHIENIKYKGLHPIEKKRTIKKINGLIDEFNKLDIIIHNDTMLLAQKYNEICEAQFTRRKMGTLNRNISLAYLSDGYFKLMSYIKKIRNERIEQFNKFLNSIVGNSSYKLEYINDEIDKYAGNLAEFKVIEIALINTKMSKIVNDLFEGTIINLLTKKQEEKLDEVHPYSIDWLRKYLMMQKMIRVF